MKQENLVYQAPELTVVEVVVEKGFAASAIGESTLGDFGREGW